MNGIIVIDKPAEFTSFDVIAVLRKTLKIKKIGHTGTLDPMATGVLPVLIGNATKIQDLIPNHDKEYCAKFKLGITTDTLDITGKVLSQTKSFVTKSEIMKVLKQFRGTIDQIPPMYSAIQKNGVRLYDLARKGITIEREKRSVTIHNLGLLEFDEENQEGTILVKCSKGTYIRSLCDDIGNTLGCGAILTDLRRTMACGFELKDSITLNDAKKGFDKDKIIPVERVFFCYNKVQVSLNQAKRFKNGGPLDIDRVTFQNQVKNGEILRVYDQDVFIGLAKVDLVKNELAIFKILNNN